MKMNASILVVDDDRIILESLGEFLRLEGYTVETACSFAEALKVMERCDIDLVVCDVNMPGGNGFELLHVARRRTPEIAVIMITGYGTIESAVEAIQMGAHDYLTKPIIDDELKLCVQRALAQQALLRENRVLREQLEAKYGLDTIVGQDYRMLKIFDLIESLADSKVTVLIQGASGTGKSVIARTVHQFGNRRDKPFVEVSCGAIPETLLESELFGHVRGAFTGAVANKEGKFQAANGGTIFLDEISVASPAFQVKLLRVLQTQQFEPVGSNNTQSVDVRVLLASNADLQEEVKAGRFREDLFYRVNVVTVELPTLTERLSDIPLLAKHFLKHSCAEMNRDIAGFDEEVLRTLQRYDWPGNVRELENVVARAVVLCKSRRIVTADLPSKLVQSADVTVPDQPYEPVPLKKALEQPEKRILEAALRANDWNRQITALQLGINRTTLYKKMKRYALDVEPAKAR